MADTKISALPTDVTTLAAGDRFPIADVSASTTDTYCTSTEIQTFACNAPVFAAGSASANSWPKLTVGTLLTTAEDGAIEMDADCLYGCTDAGNRGVIPVMHFIRADAARNLTNSTAEQKIFDSPSAGKLALETGCYRFEAQLYITSMSGTSGNVRFSPVGTTTSTTATSAAFLWHAWGIDATAPTTAATQTGSFAVTSQTAAAVSLVTAATGTGMGASISGSFEISGAGNIVPTVILSTAAAASINIGTYIAYWRIGSTSVASVGQWS